MEVDLYVPIGTDLTVIREEYPDLIEDESPHKDADAMQCWTGRSSEDCEHDEGEEEWLTYYDAIEFCGFCEGAIEDCQTMIEGNGGWAQSMLRRRDFDGLAASDATLRDWKADSDRYWAAFKRGKEAAQRTKE